MAHANESRMLTLSRSRRSGARSSYVTLCAYLAMPSVWLSPLMIAWGFSGQRFPVAGLLPLPPSSAKAPRGTAAQAAESPAVCKNFRRASFMLRVLHDAHCRAPVLLRRGALPLDRILREQPGDERGVEIRSNLHYRAIYKTADPAIPVVELETILRRG